MKKYKFISLVAAVSLISGISAIPVSANTTVNEGIRLELKATEGSTRTIELYYVGEELPDVAHYEWQMKFPAGAVTDASYTNAITADKLTFNNGTLASDNLIGFSCATNDDATNTVNDSSLLLGTLTLTIASTDDFDAKLIITDVFDKTDEYESLWVPSDHKWAEWVNADESSITIPGLGGGDKPITATPGDTFKNHADPSVKIFTADITGKDISGKDVKWILTRADGAHYTTDAIINTEVTGGLDFVLGLKIQSRDESRITDVTKAELSIKAKTVE